MSLPPDFKPAWDPSKHDSGIEEQPTEELIRFICKCGNDDFTPLHKIDLLKITHKGEVHLNMKFSPPVVVCIKCHSGYTLENIVEIQRTNDARKRPDLKVAKMPPQNPK